MLVYQRVIYIIVDIYAPVDWLLQGISYDVVFVG